MCWQRLTHAVLETEIGRLGREILRQAMSDHFALRAKDEGTEDAQGILHTAKVANQTRSLGTVFGPIPMIRMPYRHQGTVNRYPVDAVANLPVPFFLPQLGHRRITCADVFRSRGLNLSMVRCCGL